MTHIEPHQDKIETIINRHSPMESFETKEKCAADILDYIATTYRQELLDELARPIEAEIKPLDEGVTTGAPLLDAGMKAAHQADLAIIKELQANTDSV